MLNKKVLAAAVVAGLGFSSLVNAAVIDGTAEANVRFIGLTSNTVASNTLMLTGLDGAEVIEDGTLVIAADGTFQTANPVDVEARNNDGTADAPVVGDLVDVNWRINSITTLFDAAASEDVAVELTDANGVDVSTLGTFTGPANALKLSVANNAPITDLEGYSQVQVQVNLTAQLDG